MGVHVITEWNSDIDGNLYSRKPINSVGLGQWTMNSHEGSFQKVTSMIPKDMKKEIKEMADKLDFVAENPGGYSKDVPALIQVLAMLINLVREITESIPEDDKK